MIKNIVMIIIGFSFSLTISASEINKNEGLIQVASRNKANITSTTSNSGRYQRIVKYSTDAEAAKAAEKLGYIKTNYRTRNGAAVFKKGNSYISRDVDGHSGGTWKEASSPEKLNSDKTRNGTFDENMKRIGN
ncbi:MAG: toxin C-terminal domain-containing protein [Neisseria sp.]|nr:toxin C-terminal domain-containing protein [Neisseria sp.]MDO4907795.1 toxin C-terminal domain-containing protein [Neisseria sp.]